MDCIPQEKLGAVTRGLREAFGVTEVEEIRKLTGGMTRDLVFRIVVRGTPSLLRIILRVADPARHFTCMAAAAEAGLAPRVRYTNIEDRIAITDFVEGAPFPVKEALVRMPAAMRTLHALPAFPGAPHHLNTTCLFMVHEGPAVDGFLKSFRAANLLPQAESEELFARFAQLAAAYRQLEPDMVSSHNDFKPENLLFDGHRVWLVDWEAAFLNDRYNDLAVVANFIAAGEAEERTYLEAYFGEAPSAYQLARFFLMQQVAHLFYAMGYLLMGSGWSPVRGMAGSGEAVKMEEAVPDFREFHRRLWAGEVDLEGNAGKTAYGRVHLERVLGVNRGRLEEALGVLREESER